METQDKRAVESLARCGLSLQELYDSFRKFPKEEIKTIYDKIHELKGSDETHNIKLNCS